MPYQRTLTPSTIFPQSATVIKFAVQKPLYSIIYNVLEIHNYSVSCICYYPHKIHFDMHSLCSSSCEHLLNLPSMQNIVTALNTYVQSVTSQNTWSVSIFHVNRLFMSQ
jgi:hypothetical protein